MINLYVKFVNKFMIPCNYLKNIYLHLDIKMYFIFILDYRIIKITKIRNLIGG